MTDGLISMQRWGGIARALTSAHLHGEGSSHAHISPRSIRGDLPANEGLWMPRRGHDPAGLVDRDGKESLS